MYFKNSFPFMLKMTASTIHMYYVHAGVQDLPGLVRYYSGDNTLVELTNSGNDLVAKQYTQVTAAEYETVEADDVPFSPTARGVFKLDGSAGNAYHLRANCNGLPLGSADRTMMAWTRIDKLPTGSHWNHFIGYGSGRTLMAFIIMIHEGDLSGDFYGGIEPPSLIPFDSDLASSFGVWRHYAMTLENRRTVKFYINGILKTYGDLTADPNTGADRFMLGTQMNSDNSGQDFFGALAEIAIYNRALSAADLTGIVNADTAGGGGDPHFFGFGGIFFTWQGHCEVVLVKTPKLSDKVSNMEVHIRTRKVRKWSSIDAIAIQVGENLSEIESDEGKLLINGKVANEFEGDALSIVKSVAKKVISYKFVIDSNKNLMVTVNTRTKMIQTKLSGEYPQGTVGILGSPHNPGFFGRDGRKMNGKEIDAFVEAWQVNNHDPQLFQKSRKPTYPEKCLYFVQETKPNNHRHLKEIRSVAKVDASNACHNHPPGPLREFCVEDIISTGDLDVAQDTFYG